MRIEPPKIDERRFSDLLNILKEMVPHYTPEWRASDDKDAGVALLKIFSHIAETVIHRFNQVPHKNLVAFLDMMGIKLLPAQPSRVPLTFKLAKGTDKEILIPAKTQAAADKTEEHEELPFETEKNLLAIPSQLKKLISVDPQQDAIYLPPPDFLNNGELSKVQLIYKIVSSPSAGAINFQLDHVTDLKKGDFLKISQGERVKNEIMSCSSLCNFNNKLSDGGNSEYVIISGISGNIVSITDGLSRPYSAGANVEKVTRFNLLEGKNFQEHSLFIGHKDLFNIKGTAQFILSVTHKTGTEAGVTPLKVLWEYWGEVEGEEGEGWRNFQTIDTTQGLSKDGEVELVKMVKGEIKEKEINSIKSRWIRCKLKEPLKIDVSRKLSVLDNITFIVKSSGENLLPDQAFNNDIPLDITQSFTPFGTEPRMFDNFSIASKEAFSKKGAKIILDVDVEQRGILGPPTAIKYDNKIRVFARGTYGRLVEVEISPSGDTDPVWQPDHGFPPDTKIAPESMPSAVTYGSNISVFARAENGHLVERFFNGTQWQWIDRGTTDGVIVNSDPAAIYNEILVTGGYKTISVFVTGSDGSLYEFNRSPDTMAGIWIDHGRPNNKTIDSSPYAESYKKPVGEFSYEIRVKVFVTGGDGKLYELDCKAGDNTADIWTTTYGSPALIEPGVKVDSRPFAWVSSDGSHVRVYVKGSDNNLWEFDNIRVANKWQDKEYPDSISIDSAPHGYMREPGGTSEKIQIFIRGTDGNLWEWKKDASSEGWNPHQAPANSELKYSPFVIDIPDYGLRIFSASNKNSIVERNAPSEIWNEYKDPSETALTPTLSWEYWNNKGWVVIKGLMDKTANLLRSGKIAFDLSDDIEETEIAGQKSYWIRARIVGGDYGKETFALAAEMSKQRVAQLISTKNTIRSPIVNSLTISYEIVAKQFPQTCLTYNNLEYLDQTDACKEEDKHFSPFVQLEDRNKTLYLGFEKSFEGGPVRVFFAAKELPFTEEKKPKLEWTYSSENEWKELSHLDATEGLIRADILELLGPSDFSVFSRFGNYLHWLKGSLTEGEYDESPVLDGIYPNTTWAIQAETIKDEILGSSDGESEQTFSFLKFPVLEGEEIRIREVLSEEEKQNLIESLGEDAIYEVKDEKGEVTETWVLWKEVYDFFDSKENSRHYMLDRAIGKLQFGDGINGMIPPAGDNNIKAFSYQAGGGAQGNVKTGEIKTLKSAVGGVDKASNPAAADGGANTATLDEMLEIGPAMISHRNRAVTVEDFEWLAKQAARKVVKVRCLPNINNNGQTEIGWVTVVMVPDSKEDKPLPSLELKRKVRRYLENLCANTLVSAQHVYTKGPSYTEIGVSADVFVVSIDVASETEREVRSKLKAFFHPLTGGPEEKGWDFGRDVSASDIYALLEDIEGVDHVENVRFKYNGTAGEDIVEIKQDFLVANGTHEINIQLTNGGS